MFYFAQINIGFNPASILGLFQIVLGLLYLIFSIILLLLNRNRTTSLTLAFYLIQLVVAPIFLGSSGFILLFQGWRLDPVLQFQQLILSFLVSFLLFKDIVISTANRNR
ncbi:MAG: Ycf66 family protein [Cyanobacteriota bacterium]|nr:Ycf66 family protein [Cyanobacteriota bacterium]